MDDGPHRIPDIFCFKLRHSEPVKAPFQQCSAGCSAVVVHLLAGINGNRGGAGDSKDRVRLVATFPS